MEGMAWGMIMTGSALFGMLGFWLIIAAWRRYQGENTELAVVSSFAGIERETTRSTHRADRPKRPR